MRHKNHPFKAGTKVRFATVDDYDIERGLKVGDTATLIQHLDFALDLVLVDKPEFVGHDALAEKLTRYAQRAVARCPRHAFIADPRQLERVRNT